MVAGINNSPYEERFKYLEMFSLKYRRLRGSLVEVFKCVKSQYHGYLKDIFEMKGPSGNRGHPHQPVMKHSRTGLRQSFFSRRVVEY